jgi:hypothetical protein
MYVGQQIARPASVGAVPLPNIPLDSPLAVGLFYGALAVMVAGPPVTGFVAGRAYAKRTDRWGIGGATAGLGLMVAWVLN